MLIYCNWTGYCCTIILYCTSDTLCLHFICSFPFYILLITLFTAYIYTMMAFAFVLDRVGRGHIRISHSHPGLASTVFDSLWAQAYGLYEVYTRSQAEYSCLVSRSLFGFGFRLAKGSFASHAVYNIHCLICLRWFQCRLMIDEYFKSWHADCSSWSFQFYILNPNSNPCMYPFHSIRFNRLIRELIGNIIASSTLKLIPRRIGDFLVDAAHLGGVHAVFRFDVVEGLVKVIFAVTAVAVAVVVVVEVVVIATVVSTVKVVIVVVVVVVVIVIAIAVLVSTLVLNELGSEAGELIHFVFVSLEDRIG